MDTIVFNQCMDKLIKETVPRQDNKQFEAVATCVFNGDSTMIPTLMRMCLDIGKQWGVNLEELAKVTLVDKAKEYALNGDRLWNFKTTYSFNVEYKVDVLKGYLIKHLNSCMDMLTGKIDGSTDFVVQKFGDVYNYCILLQALLDEECDEIN